jgi:hypothetical protein
MTCKATQRTRHGDGPTDRRVSHLLRLPHVPNMNDHLQVEPRGDSDRLRAIRGERIA